MSIVRHTSYSSCVENHLNRSITRLLCRYNIKYEKTFMDTFYYDSGILGLSLATHRFITTLSLFSLITVMQVVIWYSLRAHWPSGQPLDTDLSIVLMESKTSSLRFKFLKWCHFLLSHCLSYRYHWLYDNSIRV